METTYEINEGVMVIHAASELDHHTAKVVKALSDEVMERESLEGIIFDFSETSFMDSSGIGMIMGRYKRLRDKGGYVGVMGVNPAIHRILEISGLYKIVEVFS